MDIESFRLYCLAKKAVTEGLPFGEGVLVFKVLDKMFATLSLNGGEASCNLKCDPERAVMLRETHACILPGYHMNKKHWNTVLLEEGLEDAFIRELIDHSYTMTIAGMPKKMQQMLENEDL